MADISTGRQRGIVPFVDETTGRLPDQYLPQGVIDLQGDLEQAVTDASQSATAAKASETAAKTSADSATQSASAAAQSAESASGDAAAAKASADGAASSASAAKSSETAAASSAAAAAESKAAAKASETAAAQSAQTATEQVSSIGDSVERAAASATAAQQSAAGAASSASNASQSASSASTSASQASGFASTASQAATTATGAASNASASAATAQQSATAAAQSASEAQNAVDGFGLEVGTTTTGEPGSDAAVSIVKQGTKYVADFTIPQGPQGPRGPKGDPGDLTTVAHDDTLTGDGTSGRPLGVNAYTTLDDNTDFNNVRTFGIYLKLWNRHAINTPITGDATQYLLLVNRAGNRDTGDTVQVIVPVGGVNGADKIYFRYFSNSNKWSEWKQLITSNDLSNYVPLSTYQALEAKVQALEAKTTYKQIATNGTDLHTLFNTSGIYIKMWGTTVVNAPSSASNGANSKYVITVLVDGGDGYMRIDPLSGISGSYYCRKSASGDISPWYKITATEVSEQEKNNV